jgi:hypothetical protein
MICIEPILEANASNTLTNTIPENEFLGFGLKKKQCSGGANVRSRRAYFYDPRIGC